MKVFSIYVYEATGSQREPLSVLEHFTIEAADKRQAFIMAAEKFTRFTWKNLLTVEIRDVTTWGRKRVR